jgi:hypothetical protein
LETAFEVLDMARATSAGRLRYYFAFLGNRQSLVHPENASASNFRAAGDRLNPPIGELAPDFVQEFTIIF